MIKRDDLRTAFGRRVYERYLGGFEEPKRRGEEPAGLFVDRPLEEILAYYTSTHVGEEERPPVLLEEKNCLLATVAAASGISTIVEGESRSGKSMILERLIGLLPEVYRVEGCSDKALTYVADVISAHRFLYVPEFQSALQGNPTVKEMFKAVSEGKPYSYERMGRRHTLDAHLTLLSTSADENALTQRRDVEVSGRFLLLQTRADEEKSRIIARYQDRRAMGLIADEVFSLGRHQRLRAHLREVGRQEAALVNPFAHAYAEGHLPPTKKAAHYRTLVASLVRAVALVDPKHHVVEDGKTFAHLADIALVHALYHDSYLDTLQRLSSQSYRALARDQAIVSEVLERKRAEHELERARIASVRGRPVDWPALWAQGRALMEERFPAVYGRWHERQVVKGSIVLAHPMKGEVVLCHDPS